MAYFTKWIKCICPLHKPSNDFQVMIDVHKMDINSLKYSILLSLLFCCTLYIMSIDRFPFRKLCIQTSRNNSKFKNLHISMFFFAPEVYIYKLYLRYLAWKTHKSNLFLSPLRLKKYRDSSVYIIGII